MKQVWIRNIQLEATDKGKIGNTIHIIDYDSFDMVCGGRWSLNLSLFQLEENPFLFRQLRPMCGNCTRVLRRQGLLTESNVYVGDRWRKYNQELDHRVANTRIKGRMLIELDEELMDNVIGVYEHANEEEKFYKEIQYPEAQKVYDGFLNKTLDTILRRKK